MRFGWKAPFGSFGSGGGVRKPASPEDIIWWAKNGVLTGTTNDVNDIAQEPQLGAAEYVGNNILSLNGVDASIDTGLSCPDATCTIDHTIGIVFSSLTNGDGVCGQGSFSGSYGISISAGNVASIVFRPNDGSLSIDSAFVPALNTPYIFRMTWDGASELRLYVDGAEIASNSGSRSGVFDANNIVLGAGFAGSATALDGDIFYWKNNSDQECTFAEGSGQPYDISGNNNRPTLVNTAWATSDYTPPYNITNGFRVAVQQTAPYIPALADGSLAADGGAITNLPSKHHNGAESLVRQTDVALDGLGFWTGDMSYADYRAHLNGGDNLWLKCQNINGVSHYDEAAQYDLAREFTAPEVEKNEKYFGDNCGTGQSALRDVNGDLITDVDGNVIFTS